MTILAQLIQTALIKDLHIVIAEQDIDTILKLRDRILKDDDKSPGFNRDTIGYRKDRDGNTRRYVKNNPR